MYLGMAVVLLGAAILFGSLTPFLVIPAFMAVIADRFIANRRCQQIGIDALFDKAGNPFPWMAEMIDLKKEKNFFETRVIEYQTGGALSWD
jgi:ribonucleoside-diphosphate reductase beta chain